MDTSLFLLFGMVILLLVLLLYLTNRRAIDSQARLSELLRENDLSAKMLVRRDMELTEANSRLQELDQTKSEFVSVAAHQLRTPLTGLRWSQLALIEGEYGKLTAEQEEAVHKGIGSTMEMLNLINNLLNIARIEEGRFGYEYRDQPLLEVIAGSIRRFKEIAAIKKVKLIGELPDEQGLHFPLDAEKLSIAFDNLIDNAVKYTPANGTVIVHADPTPAGVEVTVQDTGIGIPKDQLPHLFTKFFRAGNAKVFKTSGSGLGLYVVKNIIENHGGTLHVQSKEGSGTTFFIDLPGKRLPNS